MTNTTDIGIIVTEVKRMEYQVIHEFLSCTHEGKDIMQRMVIVQDERGVCVTSEEEWRKIWGSQHPERWKNQ